MSRLDELNKEVELLQKVKVEVEQTPEISEVDKLIKKIDKDKEHIKNLKELVKVSEVELTTKMVEVQGKLSKEVYEYLYGTAQKSVDSPKVPKQDTIKMTIVKLLLEGKTVEELAKEVYPDREQDKDTYFLIYRQVQEVEKDNCIKIVQKPTSKNNYTDIKIEKVGTW